MVAMLHTLATRIEALPDAQLMNALPIAAGGRCGPRATPGAVAPLSHPAVLEHLPLWRTAVQGPTSEIGQYLTQQTRTGTRNSYHPLFA